MQLKKGIKMKIKKLRITPALLSEIYSHSNRAAKAIRMNNQLFDYVTSSAKSKGLSLVDYYNRLVLSVIIHEQKGLDVLKVLEETDV